MESKLKGKNNSFKGVVQNKRKHEYLPGLGTDMSDVPVAEFVRRAHAKQTENHNLGNYSDVNQKKKRTPIKKKKQQKTKRRYMYMCRPGRAILP